MQVTDSAERFLSLHSQHFVVQWVSCFGGAMLRACTDRGVCVTIRRDMLDELIATGKMRRGPGWSVYAN